LILFFPKVLYGMPEPIHTSKAKLKKNNSQKEELDENDPFKEVAEEIIQYIQTEKPFINPDFQIADLSFALQIPQHHIAYCFTSILDTKFTSYRTTLRVEYAKELLREGLTDSLSIDGIGAKAGFPSRSSFYASFKSETGMTPSQYLESL
jgi:AraC-like DNA-binding protein